LIFNIYTKNITKIGQKFGGSQERDGGFGEPFGVWRVVEGLESGLGMGLKSGEKRVGVKLGKMFERVLKKQETLIRVSKNTKKSRGLIMSFLHYF